MSDQGQNDPPFLTLNSQQFSKRTGLLVESNTSSGQICHVVDFNQRDQIDLVEFREMLLKDNPSSSILQVVGDSGTSFDESSLPRARRILSHAIKQDTYIEFGWTFQIRDANWLVVDYLETHPEVGQRVIVNAVNVAIDIVGTGEWSYSNHARQMVFVNGDPSTNFGDDVWISDGVMRKGDRMICFEGGIQSLKQCINMLLAGIRVIVVTDLRSDIKFSAARLLSKLKNNESLQDDPAIQEQIERLNNVNLELITIESYQSS